MAKKAFVRPTRTEVRLTDSYWSKPERILKYADVRDWTVSQLRQEMQSYAGQQGINEDAVIVYFEQVEITEVKDG